MLLLLGGNNKTISKRWAWLKNNNFIAFFDAAAWIEASSNLWQEQWM